MRPSRLSLLLLLLSTAALADDAVYKCTASNGSVIYQDKPCTGTQRQQVMDMPPPGPAMPPPRAPAPAATVAPVEEAPPPPVERPPPPPQMFACVRATDGKVYLSNSGYHEPYMAPWGMLGAVQMPLAQAYGPSGGAGISAPEANRGKITPGLIASRYVWVQDQCRPLSYEETCRALRDEFDDNARKLRRAFKSDRPPLERREKELQGQLAGC
ncbi:MULTISPECIES: DUF4124 domain-containing protein [Dyella]|uniref:DUF4124 domain-containing protein n=2 Tax=Dyella TaxID=231454 RepID=A0A4R0YKY4_9GAMM|nr:MULTISPECIES: DUF4124 domain-containing protein [Dyella]TBR36312.1 DUF4124 domain-containing protein [Dyella terrae]TCI05969.1 DUF4124 domain-containing protein [Dyella soli]